MTQAHNRPGETFTSSDGERMRYLQERAQLNFDWLTQSERDEFHRLTQRWQEAYNAHLLATRPDGRNDTVAELTTPGDPRFKLEIVPLSEASVAVRMSDGWNVLTFEMPPAQRQELLDILQSLYDTGHAHGALQELPASFARER